MKRMHTETMPAGLMMYILRTIHNGNYERLYCILLTDLLGSGEQVAWEYFTR